MKTVTEHGVEFTIRHEGRLKRSERVCKKHSENYLRRAP
jgi:hypothetical protein